MANALIIRKGCDSSLEIELIADGNAKTSGSKQIVKTTKDYKLLVLCATNSDSNNSSSGGSFTCSGGIPLHSSSIKNYTGDSNSRGHAFMTIGIYKDVPKDSTCTLNVGGWGRVWKVFGILSGGVLTKLLTLIANIFRKEVLA